MSAQPADDSETEGLSRMLDRLERLAADEEAGDGTISLADVRDTVGARAFGPFLLVIGLVLLSPIGGIPSVPTAAAVLVVLLVGQLLMGREGIWLPRALAGRGVAAARLKRAAGWLRPPARFVDRMLAQRLTRFTEKPATYAIGVACVAIALVMPVLEVVPFANTSTAAALSAFGLGLVARDGVLVLIAFAFTAGSFYFVLRLAM